MPDVIDDDVLASRDRVVAAIIQAAESSIPLVKPTTCYANLFHCGLRNVQIVTVE